MKKEETLTLNDVTSECTALPDYISERVGGVSDVGFSSCAAPTYYLGPSISDNGIWNLRSYSEIEHSLNRDEHRVQIKAKFLEAWNRVRRNGSVGSDVCE